MRTMPRKVFVFMLLLDSRYPDFLTVASFFMLVTPGLANQNQFRTPAFVLIPT